MATSDQRDREIQALQERLSRVSEASRAINGSRPHRRLELVAGLVATGSQPQGRRAVV